MSHLNFCYSFISLTKMAPIPSHLLHVHSQTKALPYFSLFCPAVLLVLEDCIATPILFYTHTLSDRAQAVMFINMHSGHG